MRACVVRGVCGCVCVVCGLSATAPRRAHTNATRDRACPIETRSNPHLGINYVEDQDTLSGLQIKFENEDVILRDSVFINIQQKSHGARWAGGRAGVRRADVAGV